MNFLLIMFFGMFLSQNSFAADVCVGPYSITAYTRDNPAGIEECFHHQHLVDNIQTLSEALMIADSVDRTNRPFYFSSILNRVERQKCASEYQDPSRLFVSHVTIFGRNQNNNNVCMAYTSRGD